MKFFYGQQYNRKAFLQLTLIIFDSWKAFSQYPGQPNLRTVILSLVFHLLTYFANTFSIRNKKNIIQVRFPIRLLKKKRLLTFFFHNPHMGLLYLYELLHYTNEYIYPISVYTQTRTPTRTLHENLFVFSLALGLRANLKDQSPSITGWQNKFETICPQSR